MLTMRLLHQNHQDTITERTSLFRTLPSPSANSNQSTTRCQNNDTLQDAHNPTHGSNPSISRPGTRILFLAVAACLLLLAAALCTLRSTTSRADDKEPSILTLASPSDLVLTNASTVTFGELARIIIPSWYEHTLAQIPVFTPNVMPDAVYKSRKTILKTRDLVDVFGPVYPYDMWKAIRNQLNVGYMVVGEFQDLHNAHIIYSQEQLEQYRKVVLEWKNGFVEFHQQYDALAFLSAPASHGSYTHKKESHLFWYNLPKRPQAHELATPCLQMLGSGQLTRALSYLKPLFSFETVIVNGVHEEYHNLRKELRSLTDEFDLLGSTMFPVGSESSIATLKRARKLLGDINDDWTAYTFYVDNNNEYPEEQERLIQKINEEWTNLLHWFKEVDFEGILEHLGDTMTCTTVSHPEVQDEDKHILLSLPDYLEERKEHPTRHFVIGNQAGDADSIISAITLAYIESIKDDTQKTPIVSIPRANLASQRPEVRLLLELAGVSNPTRDLIFVDDALIENDTIGAQVTLVDHNVVEEQLQDKHWKVTEIVDHHEDEGKYLDTCNGDARTIAFAKGKALVASSCTLVAEQLRELWKPPPYPASLGILLLGVILLDSVNLSPRVGKVTQRDSSAVEDLLKNTDWSASSGKAKQLLDLTLVSPAPDTTAFFNLLQDTKYDPDFWMSLSTRDALRLDYKEFAIDDDDKTSFGVSTVLIPLQDFFHKDNIVPGILSYMSEVGVEFLGIMFAYEDHGGHLYRQLALCGKDDFPMEDLVSFLHQSNYGQDTLELKAIEDDGLPSENNKGLTLRYFDQQNVKPSRKQIGPFLLLFFSSSPNGGSGTRLRY